MCHFDPGWYPFDDQTCNINIGMDRDAAFVQYNATRIQLQGWFSNLQIDLNTQYKRCLSFTSWNIHNHY